MVFFRKFRKRRNIYSTDHRILKRLDKKEIKSRKRVGYYDYYIKCPECSYEYEKQLYKSQPIKAVLRSSKKHAHNKNIPWNLSKNIILEKIKKQRNRCFYTKILFNKSRC